MCILIGCICIVCRKKSCYNKNRLGSYQERIRPMRKKSQNITFRVTEDEFKMIKEKAESLKLTMTEFIVKCCTEKEISSKNK